MFWKCLQVLLLVSLCGHSSAFDLQGGDRIVVMGNGFAEGMYRHGWLEAALQSAHPDKRLTVRNLGWSGDTPSLQPRELNFGGMEEHLTWLEADVIIAAFGMNESFESEAGIDRFGEELRDWVRAMQSQKFNGETAPRLVLLSPIAHENLGPPLPDGRAHNRDLARYTQRMREVAAENRVAFVDLYAPSLAYYAEGHSRPLTRNGIHPTEYGYWYLTRIIVEQLGLAPQTAVAADASALQQLRRAIWDKNWHFFLRWRPVNMEYIRGRRREPFGVENFPREFDTLDAMISARDAVIQQRAAEVGGHPWRWTPGERELWETLPSHPDAGVRP